MVYHYRVLLTILTFQIIGLFGLYYMWDPLWLILTVVGYFLFYFIGVEAYMHRYLSHNSYSVSHPIKFFMHICSFFSCNGVPMFFAANHANHHIYSDKEGDPHPASDGIKTWFWIDFDKQYSINTSVIRRLSKDNLCIFSRDHYLKVYITTIILLGILFPKFTVYFMLIPGLLAFHAGSFVNTLQHRFGYRNFETNDKSTNIWICMFIHGQALHNNHHASPHHYSCSVKWYEFDFIGFIIKHILSNKPVKEILK